MTPDLCESYYNYKNMIIVMILTDNAWNNCNFIFMKTVLAKKFTKICSLKITGYTVFFSQLLAHLY